MAELFNNQKTDSFDVEIDNEIELSQFVKTSDVKTTKEENNTSIQETDKPEVKSPLELEQERISNSSLGLSVSKKEFEDANTPKPIRSYAENDERIKAMTDAVDESDFLLKQRMAIVPLKQYADDREYVQMVNEISHVSIDDNGKAYFKPIIDSDGNEIPFEPKFIRLRTEDDPPFSIENDSILVNGKVKEIKTDENGNVIESTSANSDDDPKSKSVKIIIDKTGLGTNIEFTDDERQKLAEANEIKLTQVEILDIASITTEKPDRSFTGNIHEHTLSTSKTTISFPASGFKADLVGLSYGEIGDISLSMESVTVDKYYKRLSTVYNKMKNLSCGPFDSFEDFLKNFAFTDISLAIYGLYVSSFPEVQTISLRCGNTKCKKSFDHNFATRNILRLEKSDQVFLDHMAELAAADPADYPAIYNKAPVRNSKFIKLPYSGFIVECGIASAYEFLYNFIPVLDEVTFKEAFGDDINEIYMNNVLLLTSVLSVRVPSKKKPGTYILCEGYKDILDAIYQINPDEIKVLSSIVNKIQKEYQVNFSFGNVVCPHCKNLTRDMEVPIDDLVFQTYQRLISTEINLENIAGL